MAASKDNTAPKDASDDKTLTREQVRDLLEAGVSYVDESDAIKILAAFDAQRARIEDQRDWINDLQSGMYINCVYCGHRYGPKSETPDTMADVLKEHIEQCPKHPMSALRANNDALRKARVKAEQAAIGRFENVQFCVETATEKATQEILKEIGESIQWTKQQEKP